MIIQTMSSHFVHCTYLLFQNSSFATFRTQLHHFERHLKWCLERDFVSLSTLNRLLVIALFGAKDMWITLKDTRRKGCASY